MRYRRDKTLSVTSTYLSSVDKTFAVIWHENENEQVEIETIVALTLPTASTKRWKIVCLGNGKMQKVTFRNSSIRSMSKKWHRCLINVSRFRFSGQVSSQKKRRESLMHFIGWMILHVGILSLPCNSTKTQLNINEHQKPRKCWVVARHFERRNTRTHTHLQKSAFIFKVVFTSTHEGILVIFLPNIFGIRWNRQRAMQVTFAMQNTKCYAICIVGGRLISFSSFEFAYTDRHWDEEIGNEHWRISHTTFHCFRKCKIYTSIIYIMFPSGRRLAFCVCVCFLNELR